MRSRNKLIFIKIAVDDGIVANQTGVAQITDITLVIVAADSECRFFARRLGEVVGNGDMVQRKITYLQHYAIAAGVANLTVVHLHISTLRHQTVVFVVMDNRVVDNRLVANIFHERRHLYARG